jgi:ubiquinone/menaquinone biosynthesis C-methylase UbiE
LTGPGALDAASLARQLRDPEGAVGVAIIEGLASINAGGSAAVIEALRIAPGSTVLELGCGLGDLAPQIANAADQNRYVGLDRSATMIDAATARHAQLVSTGRAEFHVGTSEHLPFPGDAFDRLFSVGLIHFWTEPVASLIEARRVMRPGGMMVMGCLGPDGAPPFALPEHGFHLRHATEWELLASEAGFRSVETRSAGEVEGPQGLILIATA